MSFIWCISCGEASVEESVTPSSTETAETQASNTTGSEAVLYPNIDHLRLRTEPTTTSEVVASLRLGDPLYPTGTLSSFTSEITLRGIRFTEPWVQVKTVDGDEGWVFGGALNFPEGPLSTVAQQLMEYRIQGFFGATLAPAILDYRAEYTAARSD
ncbi:MAG: SH3 domain-containing protein, partial [Bacteroidota bacterium]